MIRHKCDQCRWWHEIDTIDVPKEIQYCIPEVVENGAWDYLSGHYFEPRLCLYENRDGHCVFFRQKRTKCLQNLWNKFCSLFK